MTRIVYEQWPAERGFGVNTNLRLIPPLAEEFIVYGGDDTVERARKWALDNQYLLADGASACAHGLYGFSVDCLCHQLFRQLDHANVWVPADLSWGHPFVLSHPYADGLDAETKTYARAHSLSAESEFGDDWYGHGTVPIRLTPVSGRLLPLEEQAIVLLKVSPVEWPEESS